MMKFNLSGYPINIMIPLKEIGDELFVFDRYFDKDINIFENNRLLKLMPNQIEYKVTDVERQYKDYYSINIENGEFINIDNPETKIKLGSFAIHNVDTDGFIKRANAFNKLYPNSFYGNINQHINIMMNSGGYISIIVHTYVDENGQERIEQKYVNYDLNKNEIMELKDFFISGFDYKNAITQVISKNNPQSFYPSINEEDADTFSNHEFSFGEDGIYFNPSMPNQDLYENFVWISYEDIGFENISIFAENGIN